MKEDDLLTCYVDLKTLALRKSLIFTTLIHWNIGSFNAHFIAFFVHTTRLILNHTIIMNSTVTAVVCSDHAPLLSIFISPLLICLSVVIVVSVGGRGVRPWQLTHHALWVTSWRIRYRYYCERTALHSALTDPCNPVIHLHNISRQHCLAWWNSG